MGIFDVAGVSFDVSGAALMRGGHSVRVVSHLMMLDDTGDGFPWQLQRAHGQVASGVVVGCMRDAWGEACGSSNRQTRAHHRPQPERRCDVYQIVYTQ